MSAELLQPISVSVSGDQRARVAAAEMWSGIVQLSVQSDRGDALVTFVGQVEVLEAVVGALAEALEELRGVDLAAEERWSTMVTRAVGESRAHDRGTA